MITPIRDQLRNQLINLDEELWDFQLDRLVPFIEAYKDNACIDAYKAGANAVGNKLIKGGYDRTYTPHEIENAIETVILNKTKEENTND